MKSNSVEFFLGNPVFHRVHFSLTFLLDTFQFDFLPDTFQFEISVGRKCIYARKLIANKTLAEAFTPPAEKKIGTKWALCTTAQAGNIKIGYLRILLYIAVVLCVVIGQLHVIDKCVYHAICR